MIPYRDRLGRLMMIRGVRESGTDPCLCDHPAHPKKKCAALGCDCLFYRTAEPPDVA